MRRFRRETLAVGLLTLLLLGYGLGSYGLLEDNEARFFEMAWEMERSGDWMVPHLNFIPHFHKPPGTFWLVGASLRAFGESEWAGRLPVALAGLLTILLSWVWMRREGDEIDATRAALILVTCVEFWFLSRLVLTDMFLTVFVMLAFYCAWRSRREAESRWWLGFWLSLGATAMVKGPIGLAIVVPVLALHQLSWAPRAPWNLRPGIGIPLFLLVATPWYVAVCLTHDGLWQYFLKFQTAQRMLTTVHGRPGPWWFYLPVLIGGFFPWSVALPRAMRKAAAKTSELDWLLLIWVVYPVLFFSCAGSKLPTYLLPIFPALAMLSARAASGESARVVGRLTLSGLAVFGLAVAVYLKLGLSPELRPALPYLVALVVVLVIALMAAVVLRRRMPDLTMLAGVAFAGCLLCLASGLGPCEASYSARPLARSILQKKPPVQQVVEVSDHLHGLPYYLDQRIVQVAYPREIQFDMPDHYKRYLFPDLAAYFAWPERPESILIVLRRSDYDSTRPQGAVENFGPWVLLRPGTPPTANLQASPGTPNTGPFGGGAGLQRGG